MKITSSVLVLFLACAWFVTAARAQSDDTLLRVIRESEQHKVFARLIPLGGIDELLGRRNESYTVFAPTDDAFSKLVTFLNGNVAPASPNETVAILERVNTLLEDKKPSVPDIVAYHVVNRGRTVAKLKDASLFRTLARSGYLLNVTTDPATVLDGAPDYSDALISTPDLELANGYLNVITEVLLPVPAIDILETLKAAATPASSPTASRSPPASTSDSMPEMSSPEASAPGSPGTPGSTGPDDMMSPEPMPTSEEGGDDPVCFPASARVSVAGGGTVRMADLVEGTRVHHGQGQDEHSAVFLFTHRAPAARSRMVRLVTACGHAVVLSPGHYVRAADGTLLAARAVRAGVDSIRTVSGDCVVTTTERVESKGLFAPHSLHGDLVVDGVVASSYSAAVHPAAAHALLAPLRWVVKQGLATKPLGNTFRHGADGLAKWMPKGGDRVRRF